MTRDGSRIKLPFKLARLPAARPAFVPPMKAMPARKLPPGPDWKFEIKFDGVRALAIRDGARMELRSRTGKDLAGKYTEIAAALAALPARRFVLDGEIVALDPDGRPSFQLLQASQRQAQPPPLFYYVFDALNLQGRTLADLPLWERQVAAEFILQNSPNGLRLSRSIEARAGRVMREMQARGLEGVVAKNRLSKYEVDRRSGAWMKFKWSLRQEFVIGGFTPPQGGRCCFGALLLGYYEGDRLLYAGKVGSGFDFRMLRLLGEKFQALRTGRCPFAQLPDGAAFSRCAWLEPRLVCEVRFTEWTRDGHLRQPSFLDLREDKPPREVVRETL